MIVAMYFIVQPKDKGIWRTVLLSLCASRLSQRVRWPTAAYLEDGLPCCQKKKKETQGHGQAITAGKGIYLRHQCEFTLSLHAP